MARFGQVVSDGYSITNYGSNEVSVDWELSSLKLTFTGMGSIVKRYYAYLMHTKDFTATAPKAVASVKLQIGDNTAYIFAYDVSNTTVRDTVTTNITTDYDSTYTIVVREVQA